MDLKFFYLTLQAVSRIPQDPERIRGFFASQFNDNELLPQRRGIDLSYQYPIVQFRILEDKALLIGIGEGADFLNAMYGDTRRIKIGTIDYEITQRSTQVERCPFGISDQIHSYTFLTPWIALNQDNFREYQSMTTPERKERLQTILTGNILSVAKGLDIHVEGQITVEFTTISTTPRRLKGTGLIGFTGDFTVNFDIPQYMGLGKSVFRGFGAVEKITPVEL
ncbi:MAG: CRISPR-associated endonuclease Cas6 [Methanobacteriota archaeon]